MTSVTTTDVCKYTEGKWTSLIKTKDDLDQIGNYKLGDVSLDTLNACDFPQFMAAYNEKFKQFIQIDSEQLTNKIKKVVSKYNELAKHAVELIGQFATSAQTTTELLALNQLDSTVNKQQNITDAIEMTTSALNNIKQALENEETLEDKNIQTLLKKYKDLKVEQTNLKQDLENTKNEKNTITSSYTEANNKISSLQEKLTETTTLLGVANSAVDLAKNEINQLNDKITQLNKDIEELQKLQLTTENEKTQKSEELTKEIQSLQEQLTTEKDKLNLKIIQYEGLNEKLTRELQEKGTIQIENEKLKTSLDQQKLTQQANQQISLKTISQLKTQIKDIMDNISKEINKVGLNYAEKIDVEKTKILGKESQATLTDLQNALKFENK